MSNAAIAFHPAAVPSIPAQLTAVTKRYGETVALEKLDLSIQPGELLALLGANGAGKTTAVRIILGLAAPNEGTATVFGGNPRQTATRTRVGAILQSAKVPETLRVAEHIDLFSSYYPNPMPFAEVIEAAGLTGLERRMFGKLSGGQQKKVLFALAICGNPDLLVLDEPTAGLDVEARRALWKQIRLFIERGKSILLTTHYLAEAEALADRVMVINKGRVVAEGTPQQVKGDAATLEDAFIEMMSA
jgi:ABC-2 type transport system ATP-binding protein